MQFRYLVTGLMDEGVRAAQIVPEHLPADDSNMFSDRLTWRESRWPFLSRRRLLALAEPIDKLGVNLLHALDGELWSAAMQLGELLNLPVLLEISGADELPLIEPLLLARDETPLAFAACTTPLRDAANQVAPEDVPVVYIPPGIPRRDIEHVPSEDPAAVCVAITGVGDAGEAYDALFAAMQTVIRQHPQMQFFLSTHGKQGHELWQSVQRFGLLANLSMVPRRLGHNELLLGADAILQPHAVRRPRGLILQAMAHGLPVIAQADRWVDYLIDDQTAWVIERPDVRRWEQLLRALIESTEDCRALGGRAAEYVRTHHKMSEHIRATLDIYEQLAAEAIKFPQ